MTFVRRSYWKKGVFKTSAGTSIILKIAGDYILLWTILINNMSEQHSQHGHLINRSTGSIDDFNFQQDELDVTKVIK